MKPYGMSLSDHENCDKGCCAGNHVKLAGEANAGIRARRKTARQNAVKEIKSSLKQSNNSY